MNNSLKEALSYGGTMALVHVASVYLDIRFKVPYSAFSSLFFFPLCKIPDFV